METYKEAITRMRAALDQKVLELSTENPNMLVKEMAQILRVGMSSVQQSFRRQGIVRTHLSGRPKKQS